MDFHSVSKGDNDHEKTKDQLIMELAELRKRISCLLEDRAMLSKGEETLRILSETTLEAILFYQDDKIVYANHALEKISGYSINELLQMNIWEPVHLDYRELVKERVQARMRGDAAPSHYEIKIVTKGGEEKWANLTARRIEFKGKPAGLVTLQDITDHKHADDALKDHLHFLQVLIDSIPIPIFYKNTKGVYLGCNEAFEKYLGLAREQIVGKTVYDVSPKDLADIYREADRALLEEGGVQVYETSVAYADGKRRDVVFNKSTFSHADGSLAGLVGAIFDITERKRAEAELRRISQELEARVEARTEELTKINEALRKENAERKHAEDALRKSERKFRAIFDQTFQLIGLMTDDGTLIEVNRTALRFVGAEESDVLGKPFWEGPWWAHSGELREKLRLAIEKAAKGVFVRFEATHPMADGSLRYLDFSIKPVCDESGRVVLLIPEGRDITERKRAEEALEDAKNQAELYVDLMGHDISNLNHAIMGYLELAMDMLELKEEEKELIARPIELINSSTSLINNVKKLKRLKAGLSQKKTMDLGQAMEEAKLQYGDVPGRDVVINYTPVSGCLVMADDMLKDVFANLVENAIKHSQGALTVNMGITRTYEDGHIFYKAFVEDNGPGMPDELKNRVLDRLCLVNLGATGRGMGLCLTKALMDSYNGKISVEDRVPEDHKKGCRFVVILPAISP